MCFLVELVLSCLVVFSSWLLHEVALILGRYLYKMDFCQVWVMPEYFLHWSLIGKFLFILMVYFHKWKLFLIPTTWRKNYNLYFLCHKGDLPAKNEIVSIILLFKSSNNKNWTHKASGMLFYPALKGKKSHRDFYLSFMFACPEYVML